MTKKIIGQTSDYLKIHKKYRNLIPKPKHCPICGKKVKLEMTNDNHCYEDDIEFWKWKCHGCHRKYDVEYGLVIYKNERKKYKSL